jgi:hypothetical protein
MVGLAQLFLKTRGVLQAGQFAESWVSSLQDILRAFTK